MESNAESSKRTGGGTEPGNASNVAKHVFSWDLLPQELPPKKRFDLWREMFTGLYGAADLETDRAEPLHAAFEFVAVGEIYLNRLDCTLRRYNRTSTHVGRDARDDVLIGFNLGGAGFGHAGGRNQEIPVGRAFLSTNGEPVVNNIDKRATVVGLAVPRSRLAPIVRDADTLLPRLLPPNNAAAQHLQRYATFLLADATPFDDARLRHRIETTLLDLIVLALDARGDACHLARNRGLQRARLDAIKIYVRDHIGISDLSVAKVADFHRVTPRYLHLLFEAETKTFSEYVHEQRLKEAHRLLTSPVHQNLKVSDIAFAVGFGELSTFYRLFRRAFGSTPSDVRATALQSL